MLMAECAAMSGGTLVENITDSLPLLESGLDSLKFTVNAVAPGYMAIEMTSGLTETSGLGEEQLESIRRRSALRTLVEPADAAGAVAYLLGPDWARVTGTAVTVDAGSTA